MAYPIDHKNDTIKAIGSSTSKENAEIIQDLVHIVIDGQATTNGKEECKNLLQIMENKGIVTKDELYNRFLKEGVNKTDGDIDQFLADWLLPPHGPNHQLYTHKGWDYDYSQEEDKDYWSAVEINQSWKVKKYLLTKVIGKIYFLSESKAETLAILLYNIHRLRDIQCNNYDEKTAEKKKYLFNVSDEIEKYVIPLINDKELKNRVQGLFNDVKNIGQILTGPINDDFWQGLNVPINKLIGSIDGSKGGCVTEVVSILSEKKKR
jgi:hypothetical protein